MMLFRNYSGSREEVQLFADKSFGQPEKKLNFWLRSYCSFNLFYLDYNTVIWSLTSRTVNFPTKMGLHPHDSGNAPTVVWPASNSHILSYNMKEQQFDLATMMVISF